MHSGTCTPNVARYIHFFHCMSIYAYGFYFWGDGMDQQPIQIHSTNKRDDSSFFLKWFSFSLFFISSSHKDTVQETVKFHILSRIYTTKRKHNNRTIIVHCCIWQRYYYTQCFRYRLYIWSSSLSFSFMSSFVAAIGVTSKWMLRFLSTVSIYSTIQKYLRRIFLVVEKIDLYSLESSYKSWLYVCVWVSECVSEHTCAGLDI